MRILLDTNVVLDVLLQREPWRQDADALWQASDAGQAMAFLSATTLTDIYYFAQRREGVPHARRAVQLCLDAFAIVAVDRAALERAQQLSGYDFEDNLQMACAEAARLDAIVTRDAEGFAGSLVPVWTPAQCRARLTAG
jgi:predicted nucleic acid-binding protein